jgi:hypothetical protein
MYKLGLSTESSFNYLLFYMKNDHFVFVLKAGFVQFHIEGQTGQYSTHLVWGEPVL